MRSTRTLRLSFCACFALRHAVLAAAFVVRIMLFRFYTAHIALMTLRLSTAFFT